MSTIEMNKHACLWLRNLDMPFFLLSVDLKTASAALYSYEWAIIRSFDSTNSSKEHKLYLDRPLDFREQSEIQPYILLSDDEKEESFEHRWLGPPIVTFSLVDLVRNDTVEELYKLIKSWCLEVSHSIFLRRHNIDSDLYWTTGKAPRRTSKFTSVTSGEVVGSLEALVPLLWRAETAVGMSTNSRVPEFEAMWKLLAAHGVSVISDKLDLDDYKDFGTETFGEHAARTHDSDQE